MNWYLDVLRKYAEFSGRAKRKEYWMFILFNAIFFSILMFIDRMLGTLSAQGGIGLLSGLYLLAVLLPSIAVTVRRLHDTGRSGWWILIYLFPIVGPIILLVFMLQDSAPGYNQHGPNPKGVMAAA
ncbi:MAG TPA: DUF805 domain-containing protein [Blastocatellia bacterium]|nr:DUF805 domain-containing protein [Blastocatellia bacterium]